MKDHEVSSTAFNVAQGILLTSRRKTVNALVSEGERRFYEELLNATPLGKKKLGQLKNPLFRFLIPVVEKLMIPGLTIHYTLRKRAIEEYVRSSIESGVRQVVNLGAGFDSLAYRMAGQYPDLNVIELDHPATHGVKKEALSKMEKRFSNLHLIDIDFNKDTLEGRLQGDVKFKPNLPTIYIIEGVLMYLDEAEIERLFASLINISQKGFRLAFTFIRPDGEGVHSHGPLLALYLKIKNEPLNWKIGESELRLFMEKNKISLRSVVKSEDVLNRVLPGVGGVTVHDGELVAYAESHK